MDLGTGPPCRAKHALLSVDWFRDDNGAVQGRLNKNQPHPKMLTGENLHPHPWVKNCTRTWRVSGRVLTWRWSLSVRGFWVPTGFRAGFRTQNYSTWGCKRVSNEDLGVLI
jgi:hypothetical protein